MDNSNPFLNIFNGCYNSSNSQENLLANGLLPSSFSNVFNGLLYPSLNNNIMNIGLERMPTISNWGMPDFIGSSNPDTNTVRSPFFNQLREYRPPANNRILGWLGKLGNFNNNPQPQITNPFIRLFPGLNQQVSSNPDNQQATDPDHQMRLMIPIVRDASGKIIAW